MKNVFSKFMEDTPDTIERIVKHDWNLMLVSRVVEEEAQRNKIKNDLVVNMQMLKDIYHHLQSKSKTYP